MSRRIKEGYLEKKGDVGLVKGWKRRWFRLDATTVTYFDDEEASRGAAAEAKGSIDLCHAIVVRHDGAESASRFRFDVTVEGENGRVYVLAAESASERNAWVAALLQAIADAKGGSFYEALGSSQQRTTRSDSGNTAGGSIGMSSPAPSPAARQSTLPLPSATTNASTLDVPGADKAAARAKARRSYYETTGSAALLGSELASPTTSAGAQPFSSVGSPAATTTINRPVMARRSNYAIPAPASNAPPPADFATMLARYDERLAASPAQHVAVVEEDVSNKRDTMTDDALATMIAEEGGDYSQQVLDDNSAKRDTVFDPSLSGLMGDLNRSAASTGSGGGSRPGSYNSATYSMASNSALGSTTTYASTAGGTSGAQGACGTCASLRAEVDALREVVAAQSKALDAAHTTSADLQATIDRLQQELVAARSAQTQATAKPVLPRRSGYTISSA